MVVTLIVFCLLGGFLFGDSILEWRIVWRLIEGRSAADLPRSLSWQIWLPLMILEAVIWIVGFQQSAG